MLSRDLMAGYQHQQQIDANRKEETTFPWNKWCKKLETNVSLGHGFGTRGGIESNNPRLKQTESPGVRTLRISDLIAVISYRQRAGASSRRCNVHSDELNCAGSLLLPRPDQGDTLLIYPRGHAAKDQRNPFGSL
jgi:hypothetical protein